MARLTFVVIRNIRSYMKRDSRLSSVLHGLLHMADHDGPMTSDVLAQCMSTNPVVVRRTMGLLRNAGLVGSERGHAGGWRITADLEQVTLRDLFAALGEPAIFAMGHRQDNPPCLVEQAVNHALDDAFAEAEALLLDRFATVTLATLAADFKNRYAARRQQKDD